MKSKTIITNSVHKTNMLAQTVAKNVMPGDVLVFFGNLGSGKTTFIQALAKGLGIKKRIISPTFIIVRHYGLGLENSFYHIDLYRTSSKYDLLGLGLDQIIQEKNNIVAIEWGEKLENLMPKKRTEIHLENLTDSKRKITINEYE